jgi:peptide-N4-(N-acetyl-beta-glucosaminyl)asparagine amidase
VCDVTRRYTLKYSECLKRRKDIDEVELNEVIIRLNDSKRATMDARMKAEQVLLDKSEEQNLRSNKVLDYDLSGRFSGGEAWKKERNEI